VKTRQTGNIIQAFIITVWLVSFALAFVNFARFGSLMYLGLIMTLGTMPLAWKYGRIYCGWICPMGGVLDNVVARASRGNRPPRWIRASHLRIGAFIFFAGLGLFYWHRFPRGLALGWRGVVLGPPMLLLMSMMVVAVAVGILYRKRVFCAHLCPVGFIVAGISRGSDYDLRRTEKCLDCGKCERVCVLDDKTWPGKKSAGPECIRCMECSFACPAQAITFADGRGAS
jgi:polyferredoxin